MTLLDKVVYVSDKIANDRKTRTNYEWRRLAYLDLDLTFRKTLEASSKSVTEKGGKIHPLTEAALNNYHYDKWGEMRIKNGKNRRRNNKS
jgi:HD superfamily phosphohydrolase YqeK